MSAFDSPRLVFERGGRTSTLLSELVADREDFSIDGLAARVLLSSPSHINETPYSSISVQLEEKIDLRHSDGADARSEDEAVQRLRQVLDETIVRLLGTRTCVAVMTGGGLDSSGLLALTIRWAQARGARVFAVTNDFGGEADDRPYMALLERHFGCEVVRMAPEEGARHSLIAVDAAPFAFPAAPIEVAMMRRARELGAECVLMGEGGDDLLDGTPHALALAAKKGDWRGALRAARTLRGFGRQRRWRRLSWVLRPIIASMLPPTARIYRARRSRPRFPVWAGERLIAYLLRLHEQAVEGLATSLRSPDAKARLEEVHNERVRMHCEWLRHQEQVASGILRIDPYRDRRLMAVVARFKPEWLLAGGIRRGLFRKALGELLPRPLLEREDKAFFEPAFRRMLAAAGGFATLRPFASVPTLAELGLVEPTLFRKAFAAFTESPEDGVGWATIWPAIVVERFLQSRKAS